MRIIVSDDSAELARVGADLVVRALDARDEPVLGVATGSSPVGLYRELGRRVASGEVTLGHIRAFALDEYVGIPYDHPESYHEVVRRDVVEPLRLDPQRVRVPDGLAPDLDAACREYEQAIVDAGGIDLQILGIGGDGHIGFNEAGSSLASRTRVAPLAERTIADNARFFPTADEVPRLCVTQGVATILEARRIVLVAHGAQKAEAIARALEGAVSTSTPASALQLHPDVTVLLDEAASAQLEHLDYHRRIAELVPQR